MKKMMKKTFSLLMIFMLVFTMIPTSTLKVSAKAAAATTQAKKATTKTAKEATERAGAVFCREESLLQKD